MARAQVFDDVTEQLNKPTLDSSYLQISFLCKIIIPQMASISHLSKFSVTC